MSEHRNGTICPEGAAATRPLGVALPDRLARLVNPEVVRARMSVIDERHRAIQVNRALRRRYLEVIAKHLLETVDYA